MNMSKEQKDKAKVMLVIDENDYSHHVLMWVLNNLPHIFTTASLLVFMAQPHPKNNYVTSASLGHATLYNPVSSSSELLRCAQAKQQKLTLGLLEKAKRICGSRGVAAETITEVGDLTEVMSDVVQRHNVSLLVLGQRFNNTLRRALEGNGIKECVENANCPTLAVIDHNLHYLF